MEESESTQNKWGMAADALVIFEQLESAAPDRSKAVLPDDSPNETFHVTPWDLHYHIQHQQPLGTGQG